MNGLKRRSMSGRIDIVRSNGILISVFNNLAEILPKMYPKAKCPTAYEDFSPFFQREGNSDPNKVYTRTICQAVANCKDDSVFFRCLLTVAASRYLAFYPLVSLFQAFFQADLRLPVQHFFHQAQISVSSSHALWSLQIICLRYPFA